MGAVVGLVAGCGLLLIWLAVTQRGAGSPASGRRPAERLAQAVAVGGDGRVSLRGLLSVCLVTGSVVGVVMLAVSGVAPVAVAFGSFAAYGPVAVLKGRARRTLRERGELWPDVVDDLASGVRAGLSLPEALTRIGERGPVALRPAFVAFGGRYQRTGRFGDALDSLKAELADPVGDRVVEALRVAREVGGGDLGALLRSLSAFLRDDMRTRAELESRQSWTINAARLAVAAPWLVLLLMSLQRDVVSRYASVTGAVVLLGGAVACMVAYRMMIRIGRLPAERRVLA